MIKIDVEGFETEVVSGGRRIFETPDLRCVLMELAGYGRSTVLTKMFCAIIWLNLGFESYRYDPFTRCLKLDPVNGGNKTGYRKYPVCARH